jgi:hypothetical protein
MNPGSLSQEKFMRSIELIGRRVAPALREVLDRDGSIGKEFNNISNT